MSPYVPVLQLYAGIGRPRLCRFLTTASRGNCKRVDPSPFVASPRAIAIVPSSLAPLGRPATGPHRFTLHTYLLCYSIGGYLVQRNPDHAVLALPIPGHQPAPAQPQHREHCPTTPSTTASEVDAPRVGTGGP